MKSCAATPACLLVAALALASACSSVESVAAAESVDAGGGPGTPDTGQNVDAGSPLAPDGASALDVTGVSDVALEPDAQPDAQTPDGAAALPDIASVDAGPSDVAAPPADILAPIDTQIGPTDIALDTGPPPPPALSIDGFESLLAAGDGAALDGFVSAYDMPVCDTTQCLFVTVQPDAGSVVLLGDFDDWTGGEVMASVPFRPEVWYATIAMTVEGFVEYKLQLDGEWTTDSSNRYIRFGPFGLNSAIYEPGRSRIAWLRDVASAELGNVRDLYVYLPAAYFTDPKAHFPVLYLQDGWNVFQNPAAPFGSWDVDVTADAVMGQGMAAPVIMVGIDTQDRMNEYLYTDIQIDAETVVDPKLDLYGAFLAGTVKPLVDQTFRTLPDREHTGIGGSSLGGISSLYLAFAHGDLFGRVASFSGSYWVGEVGTDTADHPSMREVLADYDGEASPETLRIYIDSGDTSSGGGVSYEGDSWVYSDWTRNALIARGFGNRTEWDTDTDLSTPPDDLPVATQPAAVPSLAWAEEPPVPYAGWAGWLGSGSSLLSMVGHGHAHNEAAWSKRFGAALLFLFPGPAFQ